MALRLPDVIKRLGAGHSEPARIYRGEIVTHALAALVIMASLSFWSLADAGLPRRMERPVMADFGQYLAGAALIAAARTGDLYDVDVFQASYRSVVPWSQKVIYPPAYPPHLYLCFVPLTSLSYINAAALFTCVSLSCYLIAIWLLMPNEGARWLILLVALANPALQQTLMAGQLGGFALMILAWFWRSWGGRRDVMAGLALGALFWKPQLLAFAACALLIRPSARLACGVAISVSAQVVLTAAVFGQTVWRDYLSMLSRLAKHPEIFANPHQFISLRGGLGLLIDQPVVLAVCWALGTLFIMWTVRRIGRRAGPDGEPLVAITMGGLLISPHTYSYDAVMLSGGLSTLLSRSLQRGWRSRSDVVAYLVHWSPLFVAFVRVMPIQFTCWLSLTWLLVSNSSTSPRIPGAEGPSVP